MGRVDILLAGIFFIVCNFLVEGKTNGAGYSISRIHTQAGRTRGVVHVNGSGCGCLAYNCGCCAHLKIQEIGLNDTVCTNITYLPDQYGVSLTVSVDGVIYYNNTVSLTNPPPICFGVPYLKHYAKLCIKFWNMTVDKRSLSGCVRIEAWLATVIVERVDLGCFRIPPQHPKSLSSVPWKSLGRSRPVLQTIKNVKSSSQKLVRLHPAVITASTTIHLAPETASRSMGCDCLYYDCGCCAHVELDVIHVNHTACMNLTMQPETSRVNMTITVDKSVYFNETISLKELSPVCVPLIPMKEVDLCFQLYNIALKDAVVHGCGRMIVKLEGRALDITDLGCYSLPLPMKPLLFKPLKKNLRVVFEHFMRKYGVH